MRTIGITRQKGETWLDCAKRSGAPYGLEQEIEAAYWKFIGEGTEDYNAALLACMEWDVALLFEGQP